MRRSSLILLTGALALAACGDDGDGLAEYSAAFAAAIQADDDDEAGALQTTDAEAACIGDRTAEVIGEERLEEVGTPEEVEEIAVDDLSAFDLSEAQAIDVFEGVVDCVEDIEQQFIDSFELDDAEVASCLEDAIDDDDQAIWDARSPEEYRGEKVAAQRGGHIPGAINIDWLELMDRERQLRLVDLQDLQQRLDKLGLSKDKTVITHCQTHHRSGLSYLAMKILGYDRIKGYHGSWSEWGNLPSTPVE